MSLTQKPRPVNCGGHKGDVVQLAYSKVCSSGYYLASAGRDGQSMVRRGNTGSWLGTLEANKKPMLCVDISDDARLVATGCRDCTARIWNISDCRLRTEFRVDSPVRCVSIGRKSDYLAVGCRGRHSTDEELQLFAMERPDVKIKLPHINSGVQDTIFCRDDRALLTSSSDGTIRLIDLLAKVQTHAIELPNHAKSLELAADGRTVTVAYGQSVFFFDIERFVVLRHHHVPVPVMGASLHPEKETFVCAGSDHCVYKYEYATGKLLAKFAAHEHRIYSIKYSPDGEVYATASASGSLRLWQQTVGKAYGLWSTQATGWGKSSPKTQLRR